MGRGGVLASVLENECRELLPGPQITYSGFVASLLGAFLLGCFVGAAYLAFAGLAIWRWWSIAKSAAKVAIAPEAVDTDRLTEYRRR